MSKSDKSIRTIRQDADAIEKLLMQLDSSPDDPKAAKREHQRYSYRVKGITAHIKQPGDAGAVKYIIEPRDLSQGGLSFLFGGFVHIGSECNVRLISLHGSWTDTAGEVIGCSFVTGNVHEIRVRFHTKVEPQQYCSSAIHLRVLLVEDDPSIERLAKIFLAKLGADVEVAGNGQIALDKVSANVYDLVLMDIEMPEMDGITATRKLREQGYSGRIVAATAMTQPEDRQRCLEAGCDDYIPKPHTRENMARVLESIHEEPLFSTCAGDSAMTELIDDFVSELPARIRGIEDALAKKDTTEIEFLTRSLKGEGTSYGFQIITDQAAKIETALANRASTDQAKADIDELIKLCLQVRSSSVPKPPKKKTAGEQTQAKESEPKPAKSEAAKTEPAKTEAAKTEAAGSPVANG